MPSYLLRRCSVQACGKRLLLFSILLLTSCAAPTAIQPTLVPQLDVPIRDRSTATPTPIIGRNLNETAVPIQIATQSATTSQPPTPEGAGIRPQDAQQYWVPNAGSASAAEDRPPPVSVPLSLHPDDHYWFIRPIPSGSRNYDLEWYPYGNDVLHPDLDPYRIHHGLDFPNDTGTPVLAADGGVVVHAGLLPSPRNGVNYYGNTVVIQHDWQWQNKDVFTLYAHTLELFVEVGDVVEQGQLIAGVGSSGEVSGPHMHFEVRVGQNIYGDTRNPALWLAPFEGWGTLAGRFVDKNGRFITGAEIKVVPVNVQTAVRTQRTYYSAVASDDVWRENFVVADLPAGEYTLLITGIDNIQYKRDIEIFPGQTSFDVISTNFEFNPTPTPNPSPTPAPTPTANADE